MTRRRRRRRRAGPPLLRRADGGIGHRLGDGRRRHERRRHDRSGGAGAVSGLVQVAPEFGYWLNSSLMLSVQIRYEYITGTTDIYDDRTGPTSTTRPTTRWRSSPRRPGSTARSKFHPFFSLAAGGGRIRHVVSFQRHDCCSNCGPTTTRPASTRSAPGRCCSVRAAASCTTSPSARRSCVQVNSVLGVPRFQRPPRRATWASPSRSERA